MLTVYWMAKSDMQGSIGCPDQPVEYLKLKTDEGYMLKDKIIVITGGAGRLGREFCSAVAEHGGVPIVADNDLGKAESVASGIRGIKGQKAYAVQLDITNPDMLQDTIADLSNQFSCIDAVVNNAYPRNKNFGRRLEDVTYEDFCENVNLHLGGYFLVAQQFGLFFREQGHGNIINMSSIYGVVAPRFRIYDDTSMTMPVEYPAIKSAVIHLTRYFAEFFKSSGIRVNAISPGGILDKQPEKFLRAYNACCGQKGMLDARDVSGALIFLLSDASRYITGQNIIVDDGFTL